MTGLIRFVHSIVVPFPHHILMSHRAVASLVRSCPRLINLNLSGSRRLSDAAVEDIAVHCQSLEHLNLTKAVSLTDASLYSLARSCPKLRTLNLYACPHVRVDSVAITIVVLIVVPVYRQRCNRFVQKLSPFGRS